jgi:hypothetical protein
VESGRNCVSLVQSVSEVYYYTKSPESALSGPSVGHKFRMVVIPVLWIRVNQKTLTLSGLYCVTVVTGSMKIYLFEHC